MDLRELLQSHLEFQIKRKKHPLLITYLSLIFVEIAQTLFQNPTNLMILLQKFELIYEFASGQLKLDDIKDQEVVTIDLLVERVVFTRLSFEVNVIENIIEKEVIVEKDEDCFKPPEPEIDLEEVRRKEEEERQKLLEEQEALRRAELNKNAITFTNIQVKDAPYY